MYFPLIIISKWKALPFSVVEVPVVVVVFGSSPKTEFEYLNKYTTPKRKIIFLIIKILLVIIITKLKPWPCVVEVVSVVVVVVVVVVTVSSSKTEFEYVCYHSTHKNERWSFTVILMATKWPEATITLPEVVGQRVCLSPSVIFPLWHQVPSPRS